MEVEVEDEDMRKFGVGEKESIDRPADELDPTESEEQPERANDGEGDFPELLDWLVHDLGGGENIFYKRPVSGRFAGFKDKAEF
jgi:hypothetical protein